MGLGLGKGLYTRLAFSLYHAKRGVYMFLEDVLVRPSMSKKGQGLSLNVIIIAALALIVLVVLVAIFTGQIGGFRSGVDKTGDVELTQMRISYGDCHPQTAKETEFSDRVGRAPTADEKDRERSTFDDEISRCDELSSDKGLCESSGCKYQ